MTWRAKRLPDTTRLLIGCLSALLYTRGIRMSVKHVAGNIYVSVNDVAGNI